MTPDDESLPHMSIEALRDTALDLFDKFMVTTGAEPAAARSAPAEEKKHFLTLEETENIIREHAIIGPDVYAVGGDTKEEAVKQLQVLMGALLKRIMSNILRIGANMGLVDVAFDADENDFSFAVSAKGLRVHDRIRTKLENGESFNLDDLAAEEDQNPD